MGGDSEGEIGAVGPGRPAFQRECRAGQRRPGKMQMGRGTNAARLRDVPGVCVARENLRPDGSALPERDENAVASLLFNNGVADASMQPDGDMPVPAAA